MSLLDRLPRRRPPAAALYSDPAVRALVDTAEPWRPVLGIRADGSPVVDLLGYRSHAHVSAPCGQGTSTLLRAIGAQALRDGARVVILDPKRRSHRWADGAPGVEYHRDLGDIHAALLMLDAEASTCEHQALAPRTFVLIEHTSLLASGLRRYWARDNAEHGGGPSPAVEALHNLLFTGRRAGIQVVTTGTAPLSPVAADQQVHIVSAGWGTAGWRRWADTPCPPLSGLCGRWHLVVDRHAGRAFQGVFLTDAEARHVATLGRHGGSP